MIPIAPCDPPEACCVALYDIANHLLAEVFDAITECYPSDCEPIAAYVTLGIGDDGIADALTVSASAVEPSPANISGGLGLWRATYTIVLRESGWPTAHVEGETIVLPLPETQAAAAQHVFGMGEAMHRRLSYLQGRRQLAPAGVACTNARLGSMFPLNPQGGVAGWQVPVVVDLPWN